jgi:hypothetical protein
MSVHLVSGFVPIEGHPRSPTEYEELFNKLTGVTALLENPIYFFQHAIDTCWLFEYLAWSKLSPTHSVADNPKKNTLAYHIVNHQKIRWMCAAAQAKPHVDVFAWIDAGILSVPGVTIEDVAYAANAAKNEKTIVIPGCWGRPESKLCPDSQVNWRFCGGFFVCPRTYLADLETAFRAETMRHLRETNNLSWEVNTMQRLEQHSAIRLPIWWYKADHDQSMFRNYPKVANVN